MSFSCSARRMRGFPSSESRSAAGAGGRSGELPPPSRHRPRMSREPDEATGRLPWPPRIPSGESGEDPRTIGGFPSLRRDPPAKARGLPGSSATPGGRSAARGRTSRPLGQPSRPFGGSSSVLGEGPRNWGKRSRALGETFHALGRRLHRFGESLRRSGETPPAPGRTRRRLGRPPFTLGRTPLGFGGSSRSFGNWPRGRRKPCQRWASLQEAPSNYTFLASRTVESGGAVLRGRGQVPASGMREVSCSAAFGERMANLTTLETS
jgi:hypothetical protein